MAVDYYKSDDFQSVEDQLANVTGKIREIRQGMGGNGLESVRLNFGTFQHYLRELEALAERYHGEFRSQLAKHAATQMQAAKREQKSAKPKKTS